MIPVYDDVMEAERKKLGHKIVKTMPLNRRWLNRWALDNYGVTIYTFLILFRHGEMKGLKKPDSVKDICSFVGKSSGKTLREDTAFYMIHNAYKRYGLSDDQIYQFKAGRPLPEDEVPANKEIKCFCGVKFMPSPANLVLCEKCMGTKPQVKKKKKCLKCEKLFPPGKTNPFLCKDCIAQNKLTADNPAVYA